MKALSSKLPAHCCEGLEVKRRRKSKIDTEGEKDGEARGVEKEERTKKIGWH